MVIDKTKFLADQKWKADLLIRESKAEGKGLQIAAQNNLNQRGESAPYRIWDKTNPEHPDYVDPNKIPGEIKQLPIPGLPPELVHHTGGKHFTEPSMDELIEGLINGEIPRGTLGDEETENRMIQEHLEMQKQGLKIGWVKNVGDTITVEELIEGLKIIDDTETNPLKKRLRQDRMINNTPLA